MMNFSNLQPTLNPREAKVEYLSGDYKILSSGTYVTCAVTGQPIPLDELRYWNFQRQEAYASCEVSYLRDLECDASLQQLIANLKSST